jgi:hypothetical protein
MSKLKESSEAGNIILVMDCRVGDDVDGNGNRLFASGPEAVEKYPRMEME